MATNNFSKKTCLPFILFLFSFSAFCTEFTFTGTGDYADASLWTPSYPGGSIGEEHTAIISAGSECTLPFGTLLQISGKFINNGDFITFNTFGCFGNGTLINNGFILSHGTVDNLGSFTNHGEWIAEHNFSTQGGSFTNSSSGTFSNHASFIVLEIEGVTHTFEGELNGSGSINVIDYQNEGIISPGFSTGIISFRSNLNLGSAGTLKIELEGNSGPGVSGGHDQVLVESAGGIDGNIDINGTLEVILLNGFVPDAGDSWTIATGITNGDFSSLSLPAGFTWEVSILSNSIILEVIAPLPVELFTFDGEIKQNQVLLNWTTSSETNNDGWEIEHADDRLEWNTIGFVQGLVNSTDKEHYFFRHTQPLKGVNYYRLKQIDLNGTFTYSEVITLSFSNELASIIVFPNPSNGLLNFSNQVDFITLKNMHGKTILKQDVNGNSIQIEKIVSGIYFLEIVAENETKTVLVNMISN